MSELQHPGTDSPAAAGGLPHGVPPEEQLLGEIETEIVGRRSRGSSLRPGRAVLLTRENQHGEDRHAIRVESVRGKPVGHLPPGVTHWLAPLMDQGAVRVEGHVPGANREGWGGRLPARPLVLTVFLREKGRHLLEKPESWDDRDVMHRLVQQAYEEAQHYADPGMVLRLTERLRPLASQDLLPETHLLLMLIPGIAREVRAAQAVRATATLRSLLAQIVIGEPLPCQPLTIFPLSWPSPQDPPYVLLSDAIERGEAVVEELTEDGCVPALSVVNQGEKPVLVPEGEILIGAKQNRVVNVTVLIAAGTRFKLPVSCVEQGRWGYQSRRFRSAFCAPPSLRSKKMRSVQANRQSHGRSESDQGEVWEEVSRSLEEMAVPSPTASLVDGFVSIKAKLRASRQALRLPKGTAGIVVARGNRVVGLDLFDSPKTFARLRDRITDAYLFDALRNGEPTDNASSDLATSFVESLGGRARLRVPALGLGEEMEIAGECVVGAALLYSGVLCHLAAFAQTAQTEEPANPAELSGGM